MKNMNPTRQQRLDTFYFGLIIISLVINFSPYNAAAYALPLIGITGLMLYDQRRIVFSRAVIFLLIWVLNIVIHTLIFDFSQFQHAFIASITYAGLAVILLIPNKHFIKADVLMKVKRIIPWVVAVEGMLGIVQAVYGWIQIRSFDLAAGDIVEGTIHPWLAPEKTYSNVIFAIQIAMLLLFMLPDVMKGKYRISFGLGAAALLLASVMHVLIFLTACLMLVSGFFLLDFTRKSHVKWMGLILTGLILLTALMVIVLPKNFGQIERFASEFTAGKTPKVQMFTRLLSTIPEEYPYMPFVGFGPGQFSSRAGLISTELYFGGLGTPKDLPFLEGKRTEPQESFLMDLWHKHYYTPSKGSTQAPFSSWIAVVSEFGYLPILVFFGWYIINIWKTKKYIRNKPTTVKVTAVIVNAIILMIFMLGFQENNWEVPQAWFTELLILKLYSASIYAAP